MRENLETKVSNAKTLLDVLLILKEKTMQDIHVASLAYLDENIQEFNGKFGIWRCRPFPLEENQSEYTIQAYYFTENGNPSDKGLKSGQIVVILYMDKNFINNLNVTDGNPKPTQDLIYHSLKYGVILNTI